MVEIRLVPAYPSTAKIWTHMRQRYIRVADISLVCIYHTVMVCDILMLFFFLLLIIILVLLDQTNPSFCVCQFAKMQVSLPADKLLPYPPPSWARRLGRWCRWKVGGDSDLTRTKKNPKVAFVAFWKGNPRLVQEIQVGDILFHLARLMLGWCKLNGWNWWFLWQHVNSKKVIQNAFLSVSTVEIQKNTTISWQVFTQQRCQGWWLFSPQVSC